MSDLASFLRHMANPNNFNDVTCERLRLAADACDALEASQARIAAYECLQQSTQTRVRELEDDNSALKLSLASGGGRLSSGAKIWLQQKERAEQAEARVREQQADKELLASQNITLHRQCEQAEAGLAVLKDAVLDMLQYEYAGKRHPIKCDLRGLGALLDELDPAAERLLAERKLLRKLSESFASVVTEDSVRETLLCYVMGAEALATLTALRDFDKKETK